MKKYCVRVNRTWKNEIMETIQAMDNKAFFDPEGNPATFWVTTNLSLNDIENIKRVDAEIMAVESLDQ